jgi:hypothetical protein
MRSGTGYWDNQTVDPESAAVLVLDSESPDRAKTVKTCPMVAVQASRTVWCFICTNCNSDRAATTGDPTCTRGRPRHYTRMDSQYVTHIDHARTVMRGYGARRDIIDVHMRETRKTCGHLLHPQIRTARESSEKVPREFPHGGVHI